MENHVLYSNSQNTIETRVKRIEILDATEQPKNSIYTWDQVIFRVYYYANRDYKYGSFILDFWDNKQQRLVVLDSGLRLPIVQGHHHVDCSIPRFPLAVGEYYLGAGLAISNNQWLWMNSNITTLQVFGKDVFELGRPPKTKRMLFAVEHK